ncbi:MAG: hypothetical protein RIS94_565 [Pseudomonadota bacterium]|jgi:hypothetical protein
MDIAGLQKAVGTKADGIWGEASRRTLIAAFTNPAPAGLPVAEAAAIANHLGVTPRQLAAVASVESAGGGFDKAGRPRILFERHKFHRFTGGRHSPAPFSNAQAGGYSDSSWDKLLAAIATGEVDAAFMACSWGKFQVLGEFWRQLGFDSPFALARSTVAGEAGHYDLLCRFIAMSHLQDEMRALSANPESCRAFARGYNGAGYARFDYHHKLAAAMR